MALSKRRTSCFHLKCSTLSVKCKPLTMMVEGQNTVTPSNEQGSTVSIQKYKPIQSSPTFLSALQDENRKGPKRKYFEKWVFDTCEESSLHGLVWYTRVQNIWIRLIILLAVIITVFGMPSFVTFKLYLWSFDESLVTTS